MKELIVNTISKKYPIYITEDFSQLSEVLKKTKLSLNRVCIVVDSNVEKLYLEAVRKELERICSYVCVCVFEAGEKNKTLETVQNIYKCFFENKLDRKSIVIALGGGVTGDMAGFSAATYMRGISFVQIPTTLLSQVDSSVGGKTGVDFMNSKNIIGAFYQPEFVYINVETLKTLEKEQFISGMGEVVKHGFIRDKSYLKYLTENKEKIIANDIDIMKEVVYRSCLIKSEIVGLDEREQGLREILNLGHTFGHAIESLYNFKLPHGHCVALGICSALYISYLNKDISKEELQDAKVVISSFGLPTTIGNDGIFEENKLIENMIMDKKSKDGDINLVLLKKIGQAYTYAKAAEEEIKAGLSYLE